MMSAVYKIKDDLSNFDTVLDTYDAIIDGYEKDLGIDGRTYMQANVQQAAYIGYYVQIGKELDVMLLDMELRVKVQRAKAFKRVQQQSAQTHTEKSMNMMIDGDPHVISHTKAALEVKERAMKMDAIVEAFKQRGFSLNNLLKMRQGEFQNERMYVNNE